MGIFQKYPNGKDIFDLIHENITQRPIDNSIADEQFRKIMSLLADKCSVFNTLDKKIKCLIENKDLHPRVNDIVCTLFANKDVYNKKKECAQILYKYGVLDTPELYKLIGMIDKEQSKINERRKIDKEIEREIRLEKTADYIDKTAELIESATKTQDSKTVKCPKCKSISITVTSKPNLARGVAFQELFGTAGGIYGSMSNKKMYCVCMRCGKSWRLK